MSSVAWDKIELFRNFSEQDLEKVVPLFHEKDLEAGEEVISEGASGDEMFILIRGKVRVSKAMVLKGVKLPLVEMKKPRKVLATLEGEIFPIFGDMALLDEDVRSATVETLEPSTFLVMNRERFLELAGSHPDVGCRMLLALGKRLASMVRKNNHELVKLTTALALALGGKT